MYTYKQWSVHKHPYVSSYKAFTFLFSSVPEHLLKYNYCWQAISCKYVSSHVGIIRSAIENP